MSNLRLINKTTISGSQSTTDITDVFSADFDIYKIAISGISTVGTTYTGLEIRMINSSGSVEEGASDYKFAYQLLAPNTSFAEEYDDSHNGFYRMLSIYTDQAPESMGMQAFMFNPFSSTYFTTVIAQNTSAYAGIFRQEKYYGIHKKAVSCTGIRIKEEEGDRPYNSGTVKIYGLKVDS